MPKGTNSARIGPGYSFIITPQPVASFRKSAVLAGGPLTPLTPPRDCSFFRLPFCEAGPSARATDCIRADRRWRWQIVRQHRPPPFSSGPRDRAHVLQCHAPRLPTPRNSKDVFARLGSKATGHLFGGAPTERHYRQSGEQDRKNAAQAGNLVLPSRHPPV